MPCPSATPGAPVLLAAPKVSPSPSADTFSDLTMARQGYPRMAFSACFGGIIFSILLGAGGMWWWYLGQGLPQFPCLQPRESPLLLGYPWEGAGQDPPQSPWDFGNLPGACTMWGGLAWYL